MNDFWPKVLKNKDHQDTAERTRRRASWPSGPSSSTTEGAEQYYAPERKSVKMDGLHYYGGPSASTCPSIRITAPAISAIQPTRSAGRRTRDLVSYAKWIAEVADKYLFETELDEQD